MLCFGLTDKRTLLEDKKADSSEDHSIGRFLLQLIKYFGKDDVKNIPILLLGTKSDLSVEITEKEIKVVIKLFFGAGLNVISYRKDDLEGLKIYGNYSVGSDLYERSEANQWVKTSALSGENVRLAFKIMEVAILQQKSRYYK